MPSTTTGRATDAGVVFDDAGDAGQQFSFRSWVGLLEAVGFGDIEAKSTYGTTCRGGRKANGEERLSCMPGLLRIAIARSAPHPNGEKEKTSEGNLGFPDAQLRPHEPLLGRPSA
jgi:hypothetical protein